jgi:branched-chain amino acid transport system substrate-binding protein
MRDAIASPSPTPNVRLGRNPRRPRTCLARKRRVMRRFLIFFGMLVACVSPSVRAANEPVVVPVVISLTGPFALVGNAQKLALDTLMKTVNETGGINGRPLQFEFLDDATNASNTVQLTNQLIAKKVPVMIGPSFVATCRAVAPLLTAGPVNYCMSSSGPTPKDGFSFTAGYSTVDANRVALNYFRQRGLHKIALLFPTDATGQDGEQTLDTALALPENRDMTVVAREHFNTSDISVAAQIAHIKAANPDVLDAWTTGAPLSTVLHGLQYAGYDLPVLTSYGNLLYSAMGQFGDLAPKAGLYFAGPQFLARAYLPKGPALTAVDTFLKAFAAVGSKPDAVLSTEWDAGLVVVEALRHVGPDPTADQVRRYIEGLHGVSGASANFDFRDGSQRGISAATITVARWDPTNHTFVPVSAPGGKPLPRAR